MTGRKFVKPIRDKKIIQRVKDSLLADENYKIFLLFVLGINTGLRISDLLNLKWEHIMTKKGKIVERISLTEQKTGKHQEIPFGKNVVEAIALYKNNVDNTKGYIFKPDKTNTGDYDKPISMQYVHKILNYYICERAGYKEAVGCHTLRKTWGYMAYMQGWDIYRIQECLNHSSPTITRRYIDLSQDDKDKVYKSLEL